jgi:hypothetical protein
MLAVTRMCPSVASWRAFLPAITGFGLHQPGRYAALPFTRIHNLEIEGASGETQARTVHLIEKSSHAHKKRWASSHTYDHATMVI